MMDLHMHSCYSDDGEYTPSQLMSRCASQGLCVVSVTDHNCVKANQEAMEAAEREKIACIPGIEIDCVHQSRNFHVLGYGIDFTNEAFEQIEKNIERQGFEASLEMLEKTQILGFSGVTEKDMWQLSENRYWKGVWTGEMFAEVLLHKPEYEEHPLLLPYRPGGARSDNPYVNFYWDYYSQGRPCHVKIEYPAIERIIEIIHENRGIAVLAHPGANLKGREELLTGILDTVPGLDGLEAFSSYHSVQQAIFFYREARARKLYVTCGSDFHGKTKPSIQLGSFSYGPAVDFTGEMRKIVERLLEK